MHAHDCHSSTGRIGYDQPMLSLKTRDIVLFSLLAAGCGSSTTSGTQSDAAPQDAAIDAISFDAVPGDTDQDGIGDVEEGRFDPNGPRDSDGDGTPDWQDTDSDNDTISDADEGTGDVDGDNIPDWLDPLNSGVIGEITLTAISTTFNNPIGIDYHYPTDSVVVSVNYPTGSPINLERIELDGTHKSFSTLSGLTDEVKIATVSKDNPGGFVPGDLFVGNGEDGQIVRVTDDGSTVVNPWVDLPGDGNGLMRGSLYADRTGIFGGDLIIVTNVCEVWRINSAAEPTLIANAGVHLEGMVVVPNSPERYGPLAGKIIAGAEGVSLLYAFATDGTVTTHDVGVAIEDIDLVRPKANFFGINYGTSTLLGAAHTDFVGMVGDILLTEEHPGSLSVLRWNGSVLETHLIQVSDASATVGQWEHVTFAEAGIAEVPPVIE